MPTTPPHADAAAPAVLKTMRPGARKVLICRLGDQDYGIDLEAVQEIVAMPTLSRPPGLPPLLAGFLNLEGDSAPVVKLAALFALSDEPPDLYTPLILLRCAEQPLALLVDSVQAIVSIDEQAVVPFRENDSAEGLVSVADRNVILLSPGRLLREQEKRRLADLASIEQARLERFEETRS